MSLDVPLKFHIPYRHDTFSAFQEAYAAKEDHIRKLWDAILQEQRVLQVILVVASVHIGIILTAIFL